MFKSLIVSLVLAGSAHAAAPSSVLYECLTFRDSVVTRVTVLGDRQTGPTEVTFDRESRQVLDIRSSAGQLHQLFSTRDGKTTSGDFITTLYEGTDKLGRIHGLFVLYPTTKRIEMPIVCKDLH